MQMERMMSRDVLSDVDAWLRHLDAGRLRLRGFDGWHGLRQASERLVPQVLVRNESDAVELVADVPGLKPQDIEVTFEEGVLTVIGRHEPAHVEEGWTVHQSERHVASFERAFRIDVPVDADAISARMHAGVLKVRVPKQAPSVVQIPVVAG